MSALRRIKKVKGGYEVTVSCSNKPTLTAFYRTYEQCEKFADDYFIDYLGVALKSVHHPENDGVVPESLNAESLETAEIEIPMNKRLKELAEQAGLMPMWVCVNEPTGSQMIKPIDEQTIERFAELVRQDEREAIAKSLEVTYAKGDGTAGWFDILAKDIRERGNYER